MSTLLVLAQLSLSAQVIPVATRVDGIPGGGSLTELRFVQSVVHGGWSRGSLDLTATLSLEGLTMPGGQLNPGAWGEGFIDRRHPHTYLHEAVLSLTDALELPLVSWSVSAGKGFAPFGTDDPMSRPAVAFPVNHHWSQVLERAFVAAAVSAGPAMIEGALFNGDEPESPGQWPQWNRFADSWSLRATLTGGPLEAQLSRARVLSPEHRQGAGLEHLMWSGSVRFEQNGIIALAEFARTDEEGAFQFSSVLAEAELRRGRHRPYARFERTERPEEMRVFGDPFRGVRPHNENSNLGTTRWTVATAGYGHRRGGFGPLQLETIAEISLAHVSSVTGIIIVPEQFYGRNDLWSFSVGLRIAAGSRPHRMGRYGLARQPGNHPVNGHAH